MGLSEVLLLKTRRRRVIEDGYLFFKKKKSLCSSRLSNVLLISFPVKIAIDVDDTLAEYTEALLQYHGNILGSALNPREHHYYQSKSFWGNSLEEKLLLLNEFDFTEAFDNIKPVKGAQHVVNELAKLHQLFVITSRPLCVKKKTEAWLETYFPGKFSDVYMDSSWKREGSCIDKSMTCRKLNVDCLIEDSHEQAQKCHSKVTKVILFNRPWNQNEDIPLGVKRVDNWNRVLPLVSELFRSAPVS